MKLRITGARFFKLFLSLALFFPNLVAAQPSQNFVGTGCQVSASNIFGAILAFNRECGSFSRSDGNDCRRVGTRWICFSDASEVTPVQQPAPQEPPSQQAQPQQAQPQQTVPQRPAVRPATLQPTIQSQPTVSNTPSVTISRPTACQTSGPSLGVAKAAFERECGVYDKSAGHDCDPANGGWICSGQTIRGGGSSPVVTSSPSQPQQPPASTTPAVPLPAPLPVTPPAPVVASGGNCNTTINPGGGLQGAINGASGGQTLCLNSGNYSTSGTLVINKNITIRGVNAANPPIIRMTDPRRGVAINRSQNLRLDNLIFDGGNTAAREITVLITGSNNTRFQNVTIQNAAGIGLGIHSSANTTILGGTIQNIGQDPGLRQAIWAANGSSNVVIDGLTVNGRANDRAGGDHAITCIGISGFTVRNSRSTNAGSGVVAVNDCDNILVENNTLVGGKEHGVDIVNGSTNAVVRNNDIRGMSRSAMVFDDHAWNQAGGGNPTRLTVSNNRMSGNNTAGSARCRGIGVDRNMVINPNAAERSRSRWVVIENNNTIDSGPVYCDHVH